MSAIVVRGATRHFQSRAHADGLVAYESIDFSVEPGEFVCLLGASGCGKSSLLNALAGLDPAVDGDIRVMGHPVYGKAVSDRVSVGYVFQEPRLLPWLSVERNIRFALRSANVPRDDWAPRIDTWLDRVGLREFTSAYPHELSGGMQQRVAIARAFAVDPDVLLMDEPFSGLDEFTARAMREHLLDLWEATGKTIVFVTHNCFESCFLADRILIMTPRPGRIAHDRPVALTRPRRYDDSAVFEESVRVTNILTGMAPQGGRERQPVTGEGSDVVPASRRAGSAG